MKRFTFYVIIVLFVIGLFACGGEGGKYDDAVDLMEKQISVTETFADNMNAATSGEEVASALNSYSDGMKELIPEMKDMMEKYPEMRGQGSEEVPEKLQALLERMNTEVQPKLQSAMVKLGEYSDDPAVQEAQKKFQETMMEMMQ